MAERYFVISSGEGHVSATEMDKATLLARLEEDYWGPRPYVQALHSLAGRSVGLGEHRGLLIIKGQQVEPVAVEVVKKFDIE